MDKDLSARPRLRLVPPSSPDKGSSPCRLRPSSDADFLRYAKNLAWLRGLPLQASQELLARIYGYADVHELRAVLAQPGEPGPFSPLLFEFRPGRPKRTLLSAPPGFAPGQRGMFNRTGPPDIRDEDPRERARTTRLLEEVFHPSLEMADGAAAFRRRLAIFEAGFFCAPKDHRTMFKIIKDGCLAAEHSVANYAEFLQDHWPVGYWGLIEFEYRHYPIRTVHQSLKSDPWRDEMDTLWEPGLMHRALEAFQAPRLFSAIVESYAPATQGPRMNWRDWLRGDEIDWGSAAGDCVDWFKSPWLSYLTETAYPDCTAKAFQPGSLTDEQHDDAEELLTSLDRSLILGNPLLEAIPTVLELARGWRLEQLRQLSALCVERARPQTVLETSTYWPTLPRRNKEELSRLHVTARFELAKDADLADDDWAELSIWRYNATFTGRADPFTGRPRSQELVGSISGWLIAPFDEKYYTDANSFFEAMDEESAELNDVWQVLQSVYFPSLGLADVGDFCQQYPLETLATAHVSLLPKFRGVGLVPACLNLLYDALTDCDGTSVDYGVQQSARMLRPAELGEDAANADSLGEVYNVEAHPRLSSIGAPKVFVLGITGERPEPPEPNPVAPWPIARRLKKNPEAPGEARKKKLMRHFLGMRRELECDLVVYDPFEYPNT